jgi:hypothetical protein
VKAEVVQMYAARCAQHGNLGWPTVDRKAARRWVRGHNKELHSDAERCPAQLDLVGEKFLEEATEGSVQCRKAAGHKGPHGGRTYKRPKGVGLAQPPVGGWPFTWETPKDEPPVVTESEDQEKCVTLPEPLPGPVGSWLAMSPCDGCDCGIQFLTGPSHEMELRMACGRTWTWYPNQSAAKR